MIRKRNNKRSLYESIMRDVAKTVKRNLNESSEQYENDVDELTSMIDRQQKIMVHKKKL